MFFVTPPGTPHTDTQAMLMAAQSSPAIKSLVAANGNILTAELILNCPDVTDEMKTVMLKAFGHQYP